MAKSKKKDQAKSTLKAEKQGKSDNHGIVLKKNDKKSQPTEAEIVVARIELLQSRASRIQRELLSIESLYNYLEESHILSFEDLETVGDAIYKIEVHLRAALEEQEKERVKLVTNYNPKDTSA